MPKPLSSIIGLAARAMCELLLKPSFGSPLRASSCDSFNTAMLRILRIPEPDSTTMENAVEAPLVPHSSTHPIQPVVRGRSSLSAGQPLRSGTSVSAVEAAITAQIPHGNVAQRALRSASPVLLSQQAVTWTSDSLDSDDEDSDEVSFWGGSPRPSERLRSPSSRKSTDVISDQDESSSSDDETSDNENDNASDDFESDDSDEMELVGHV